MMSLFEKKGIAVASGFDLQSEKQHLDSRSSVTDITERNRLVDEHAAPEGLITFVKSEGKWYGYLGKDEAENPIWQEAFAATALNEQEIEEAIRATDESADETTE